MNNKKDEGVENVEEVLESDKEKVAQAQFNVTIVMILDTSHDITFT